MLLKVYKSRVWILLFMFMPFIGNAQIDDLPEGWDINFHPNSATYAIPTTVAFNGVDALATGDWIGAFYMDNGVMECGGAVQWDGTNNLGLVVFGNDTLVAPDKTGFSEGEPINWMVYRAADECVKAYDAEGAEFNWMNQVLTAVASFGVCEECQEIALAPGFQFISSYIAAPDPDMQAVMTDVLGSLDYAVNSDGGKLVQFFGAWQNGIGAWMNEEGYLVKMTGLETLEICGDRLDAQTPIDLGTGFQFVSYLDDQPQDALVAFDGILDNLDYAVNSDGGKLVQFFGAWQNGIGLLNPGEGYLAKMTGDDQLIYPPTDALNQGAFNTSSKKDRGVHWPTVLGDPSDVIWTIYVFNADFNGVALEAGDELAIYDGDLLVGSLVLPGDPPGGPNPAFALKVWHALTNGPGFVFGNEFTVKCWDASEDLESTDFTHTFLEGGYQGDVFPDDSELTAAQFNFVGDAPEAPVLDSATAGDGSVDLAWTPIGDEPTDGVHWPTVLGDPSDVIWTIYVFNADLNGTALEAGDELAIYDGNLLVGSLVLPGDPPGGPNPAFALKVWHALTNGPGFVFGNEFTVKCWDASEDLESTDFTYTFLAGGYQGDVFPDDSELTAAQFAFTAEAGYVPTFNIYQDGALAVEGVEGNTYTVDGLTNGQEYCFTVSQIMEDLSESGQSEEKCATPEAICEDVAINNFPEAPANVCMGEEVVINFEAVDVLNAVSEVWSVDPVGAGAFEGTTFNLDMAYVGFVTVSVFGEATPPCADGYASLTFEVFALPVVECPADFAVCVDAVAFALDGATPAGGVYSGVGVDAGMFDPAVAGVGDVEVTYTYEDANMCVNFCTFYITVNPLPVVECPADFAVCIDADEFALTGATPEGGYYSGVGVDFDMFNPAVGGVGTTQVTYTYQDANMCINYCTFNITVNPLPVVECPADFAVCIDAEPWDLYGGTPDGGVYSGVGVDMGMFDASVAGVGTFEITYTVEDANMCVSFCTFNITVNPLPVVECPPTYDTVCQESAYIDFEMIANGEYTNEDGEVVLGFDPIEEGFFEFELTVTENGCSTSCYFAIIVTPLPVVECPEFVAVCEESAYIDFEAVTNGEYTNELGEVVTGFAPAMAGTYTFTLTVTEYGCMDDCDFSIVVNALPVVTCPGDMTILLGDLPYTLEGATPAGGTYSGEGVVEGEFSVEMTGDYGITYTYENENGCVDDCSFTITVVEGECINPPTAFAGDDVAVCANEVYELAGAATNYTSVMWTTFGDGMFDDPTALNPTYTPGIMDLMGTVELCMAVQPSDVLCDPAMDCMLLSFNELPSVEFVLSANEICLDETLFVTATGPEDGAYPYTITGTFNGEPVDGIMGSMTEELELVAPAPGTYVAVLTGIVDANGCAVELNEEFVVVVNPLPYITLALDDDEICLGESVTGTITGPADGFYPYTVVYTLNGEEMTGMIDGTPLVVPLTPDMAGLYTLEVVSVVDANECMAMEVEGLELLVHELPVAVCPAYDAVCEGSDMIDFPEVEDGVYTDAEGTVFGFDPIMAGTYMFTLTVTNEFGCTDFCGFEVVVNPLPYIELALDDDEICLGESVTGTISGPADGFYPYTVVYTLNDVEMTGVIDVTPLVVPLTPDMAGLYTLEVISVVDANGCVAMAVEGVELTVLPLTEIIMQPVSLIVEYSYPAEFSVEAVNATGYQWYLGLDMIAGATDATYSIESAMPGDAGNYYCEVMGDCGNLMSVTVTLTVLPWTQTVNFLGAVNGFSTYLDLTETSVATIFGGLPALQQVDFVSPNFTWVPGGLPYNLNEDKGAKVNFGEGGYPSSVDVTGYPILGSTVYVPYSANGSYLPVRSQSVVLADDVFGPHIADIFAVFSMDYSGYWFPGYGSFTLEYLVPGSSYSVLLYNDVTFDFDVPAVDAAPGYANLPRNITTWNDAVLTATQHNIVITSDAMSQLEDGDVVAAFNEYNQMTGMVEITNTNEIAMLRTFGDNPFTEKTEGFVEGDVMTIKVWRNGEEMMAQATFDANLPNQNVFAENGVSAITSLKLGVTSINDFTSNLTASLYPNPATDLVNIATNFEISNVKVVNYVGQVVFEQDVNQMNFQINTSNYGSGMYFVQIENQDGVVITKRLTVK